jgi:hypothetical protein
LEYVDEKIWPANKFKPMKNHHKILSAVLLLILLAVGWRFWGVQSVPSKVQPSGAKPTGSGVKV